MPDDLRTMPNPFIMGNASLSDVDAILAEIRKGHEEIRALIKLEGEKTRAQLELMKQEILEALKNA